MKIAIWIIIATFLVSGTLHLVNPDAFMWLMPPWLPVPTFLIYLSGVLELISGVGLVLQKKWAALLAVLVLIGVWPANIWFAFNVISTGDAALIAAAWIRLPLQLPLIYFAWKYFRTPTRLPQALG
jgi:uncharacterized membrane protein